MADLHALAAAELASGPLELPAPVVAASSVRVATSPSSVPGAVPMRIPAILRVQGKKSAQQGVRKQDHRGEDGATPLHPRVKAAPGGKRRRRRWENAQLAGNPHLHRPSRADFSPGPSLKNLRPPTFAPPPRTFSRSTYVSSSPAASAAAAETGSSSSSSAHGQFSMSLRGLRRTLRGSLGARGGASEAVLEVMERELCAWLTLSGRIPEGFFHDSGAGTGASLAEACARGKVLDATPLEDWVPPEDAFPSLPDLPSHPSRPGQPSPPAAPPTLTELSRQPHALVWLAPSPHHRFLLHALARYYALSSFSRPLSPLEPGVRVTHVLRPQIARARGAGGGGGGMRGGAAGAETPPGTDWTSAGGGGGGDGETTDASVGGAGSTTEDGDGDGDGGLLSDADAEDTDTDGSVLSAPLEADEDALSDWEEGLPPPAAAAVGVGATDDEAEAVYSSATNSSAEDTGDERDLLARRFAHLGPGTPARLASPLARSGAVGWGAGGGSATPRATAAAAAPPFAPFSPVGASDPGTPLTRPVDRARGRRSLPLASSAAAAAEGYSSAAESSPSRSPTRTGLGLSARAAFVGVEAGEWRSPELAFVSWIYE